MKRSKILLIDAIINFALGLLLLFYSKGIAEFIGVPYVENYFYPNILGGVLSGIGLALIIEYAGKPKGFTGLGLGGAVAINLCGGIVLAVWLIFGNLELPTKGFIFLWALVILLVGISLSELAIFNRKEN
ncbi:hypothetical protein ACFLTH_16510 [Bacteroidota bacterium]